MHPLARSAPNCGIPRRVFRYTEIAASWTMEPQKIRIVFSPDGFPEALEEWKK